MASSQLKELAAHLPLTSPIPNFVTNPEIVPKTPAGVEAEYDVLRNADVIHRWTAHISQIKDEVLASELEARGTQSELELEVLGEKLSTEAGRLGLKRLTDVYERALQHFPTSFKLWKSYLQMRSLYVLGKPAKKVNLGAPKRKKFAEGEGGVVGFLKGSLDDSEGDRDVDSDWKGGLDGIVGWEEWSSLAGVHERAVMWLPQMPRLWLSYLTIFLHPQCPAFLSHTHARRTFDRALRTLAGGLHERIWRVYLRWAQKLGGETLARVFRRYLKIDPTPTEYYIDLLISSENLQPRPLEAAKHTLLLARKAARGKYKSVEGRSPYALLGRFLEIVENHADEVGLDVDEVEALRKKNRDEKEAGEGGNQDAAAGGKDDRAIEPASTQGETLIRLAGPAVPTPDHQVAENRRRGGKGQAQPLVVDGPEVSDPDVDPPNSQKLDVEAIIRKDGLEIYKDQAGRLWTGLATFWIKKGEFDKARETFEEGMKTVVTVRDFTQIFDAYAEFSESYISTLMDALNNPDPDADPEDAVGPEEEKELDQRMKEFEDLMDRRPFLVNEVLLRRNPNDVREWEKRVALWGTNDEKIIDTYTSAITAIQPRKAVGPLHQLFISFAKFYEEGGAATNEEDRAEKDLESARKVFEKAITVPFKKVDDLAEVWCEWAEMEVRNENYDEGIRVMQRATAVPKKDKVSFHDESLPAQSRLFKSLKLHSFYIDLEESIGTVESTKQAYDKVFELKIANAQTIINYATFLQENEYWEESFKVYERGIDLFPYPIQFEIWNTYLSKFLKRYGGDKIERTRDLFEQALEKCPSKFAKPLYLMYGQLEEDHGLAKRAMGVYEKATKAVDSADRFEMYSYYIAKAAATYGLPATRPIYERAIEELPDRQTAEMCLRFASLERKLGEIDRARAIYAHGSQFCDPRVNPGFWEEWNAFEIDHGSEDTFREMLRIKRAVRASFNTETSYLAARAAAARKGQTSAADESAGGVPADPMAALEGAQGAGAGGATGMGGFVRAKETLNAPPPQAETAEAPAANVDQIDIDEDDL